MWPVPMPAYPGYPQPGYPPVAPPPAPAEVVEEERRSPLVQTSHNATYNINPILANTITASDYFLSLLAEYQSFEAVVDVIRDECVHVEPFEPGKAHLPSYAFCCMYRLFMLKLDVSQLNVMLRHKSPYVRAIGLLYLRCIGEPSQLLGWCELHLEDETQFKPGSDVNSRPVSVADWFLNTIRDSKYYEANLQRVPVPIVRAFERKSIEVQIKKERAEKLRKYINVNMKCRCKWSDGIVYDAVVLQILENGKFYVSYTEYGNEEEVSIMDFDAESVKKQQEKEKRRSVSAGRKEERSRSRDRDRCILPMCIPSAAIESIAHPCYLFVSNDLLFWNSYSYRDRERRRSRSRSRERDRRSRKRSRTPEPEISIEEEIERRMQKLRDTEKSSATSSDGRYCSQIVSYKKSLSKQFKGGTTFDNTNKKLDLPDAHPRKSGGTRKRRSRSRSPSPAYVREKKELTHEQKMKQIELLARYGDLKK